jgi:transaldolase
MVRNLENLLKTEINVKFFIDTADIEEVKIAADYGILDGVTTNPSLVAKTGREYRDVIRDIAAVCQGPISAEVLATDFDGMMREAHEWAAIADNIVVKIPLIEHGIKAVVACARNGIKTNVTLCFNSNQALLAAKAGATYISPFVGRLDDIGINGLDTIGEIKKIYQNYSFKTEILVASIRNPIHLRDAALWGADVATIPLNVFQQLVKHPLTDAGLEKFLVDAKKIPSAVR